MKRHPVLARVSRDHHPALILAQLLKINAAPYKNMPTDATGKMCYAGEFYESHLVSHFKEEESILDIVKGLDPVLDKKGEEIIAEHILLHKMFAQLPAMADLKTAMDDLGQALDKHIRKEERELFPLIETFCDEEKMRSIERVLSR